ncbi:MAG: YedE-related selenium metabolism membrane protein, partial [Clostridia bacterium]|nr:YedE-related selenium metabolism membrane protein [Clostridia bacterium]
MKKYLPVLLTGIVIGICALVLTAAGNPANMGFCIACFLRDIAGAIKLHSAAVVQYVRPEIIGIIVGAMAAALIKKEWKAVGGSSPVTRFLLAVVVMIGALVFLGCPLRMVIRIGGGDFNAIVGLVGFIAGIFVGTIALKKGFSLKRTYAQTCVEGSFMPIMFMVLMVLVALVPSLFVFSAEGPGSMTAPVLMALAAGAIVGVLAQRSRFCMAGGIRDSIMFNQW